MRTCAGLFSTLLVVLPAAAQNVAKVDPRALAMGGAYVAVADGHAALQWNPAGLWVSGRREVAATLGSVPLEGGEWVESLRVAGGFSRAVTPADAAATLGSPDAGLAGERNIGVYVTSVRFGGALQQLSYADERARSVGGGLVIDTASLRTREFQFSAAHPLMMGRLVLGASARLVQAEGRMGVTPLDSLSGSALTAGNLMDLARQGPVLADDTVFAVDVGVLLMASSMFRIGGVVKNLNAPAIEPVPGGDETADPGFRLPRQIRVGGLLMPHPQVSFTLDLDLTTDVLIDGGRQRRELGGGFEWSGEAVAIRGGLLFDLLSVQSRPLYTFGLGVGGDTFRIDLAGSWRPDRDGLGWAGALAAEF